MKNALEFASNMSIRDYWGYIDGEHYYPAEMDTRHLNNTISYLLRNATEIRTAFELNNLLAAQEEKVTDRISRYANLQQLSKLSDYEFLFQYCTIFALLVKEQERRHNDDQFAKYAAMDTMQTDQVAHVLRQAKKNGLSSDGLLSLWQSIKDETAEEAVFHYGR